MMKLTIRNVRGIAGGDVELEGVSLVAGLNGSGKSSTAIAAAAALMQSPAPLPGMKKTEARVLLRDHQDRGRSLLQSSAGRIAVNYPGGKVSVEGAPPQASAIACGLASIADMPAATRAAYLIQSLRAEPTLDQLTAAFTEAEASEKAAKACWDKIEQEGWDGAHKYTKSKATEQKGAWQQITGEKWGAEKGKHWRPAGLPEDANAEALGKALEDARQRLEATIAQQAVSGAEVERLKGVAEQPFEDEAPLKNERQQVIADIETKQAAFNEAKQHGEALPKPGQVEATVPCPSCGTHLVVASRSELALPSGDGPSDEENAKRQAALDEARATLTSISDELKAMMQRGREIDSHLQNIARNKEQAQQAAEQLKSLKTEGASQDQVQQARDDVSNAESMLAMLNQWHDASTSHRAVTAYLAMSDVLAPTGLRQTVLAQRLSDLNTELSGICELSRWAVVSIDSDIGISYAGRDYSALSESEKFRVRVTLQIALSKMDGSQCLVIDAADILDRQGRGGLMAALMKSCNVPALVTMTMDSADSLPPLTGRHKAYWVENGTITAKG